MVLGSGNTEMKRSALPPPRWITFDCYGTLIDWGGGVRKAFRELARANAEEAEELSSIWEKLQWEMIQQPYSTYAQIMNSSFREALDEFGISCAPHTADAFVESLARWEPFPDVNPALSMLSRRYKLAIISNIDRDLLGRTLRHFPIRFDALITAEDAGFYKPRPEIFRYALGKLMSAPVEIAHVSFSPEYDLVPASGLGFRLIYLNRDQLPAPEVQLEAEIRQAGELIDLWEK